MRCIRFSVPHARHEPAPSPRVPRLVRAMTCVIGSMRATRGAAVHARYSVRIVGVNDNHFIKITFIRVSALFTRPPVAPKPRTPSRLTYAPLTCQLARRRHDASHHRPSRPHTALSGPSVGAIHAPARPQTEQRPRRKPRASCGIAWAPQLHLRRRRRRPRAPDGRLAHTGAHRAEHTPTCDEARTR